MIQDARMLKIQEGRAGGVLPLGLLLLAALFGSLAGGSASANASRVVHRNRALGGKPARISLSVPRSIVSEAPAVARGRITRSLRHAGVTIEGRGRHGWLPLARGKVRHAAFRVSFVVPAGSRETRIRAALVQGRRRLATSVARPIRVTTGGGPTGDAYWGAWVGSQLTGTAAPWDMSAVSAFERMVGKPVSMIEFGSPFADCSVSPCSYFEFPARSFSEIRARGAIPFFSWGSSESVPGGVTEPDFQLSDLIGGAYDEYIRSFAEAAKRWGHPFFLRFDWEMNGDWFPWGDGVNGNQPGEFAAAWRHVHDIFTSVGATNATWVWCPYVNRNDDLASLYPGAQYVDWTCLDGYNWGTNPALPKTWQSFNELFGPTYQLVEKIAPDKPMVIGETASTEYGGSKAEWIQEMFRELPSEFPNVRGLVWYEALANGMDWPLESSGSAIGSFAAGIDDSRYLGNTLGNIATTPIPAP